MSDLQLYLCEFFGTAMLVGMGLSVVASISLRKSGFHGSGGLMAALGWGSAMTAVAVIVGPFSGAHVNPAFTLGFWMTGNIEGRLVPGYLVAQLLGASFGALIMWFLFKDHLDQEGDAGAILGAFATGPSIRNPIRNVASELVATYCLMILVLSLGHSQPAGGVQFIYVWVALSGGVMAFAGLTGYAINPARDLMPRLLHMVLPIKGKGSSDWSYAWVPIVGPFLGAALAALTHIALFAPLVG
ncbi:MAG: aquaporin family protein [Propionibacteriaceae bacterium]|jgi:glycerol uptake facilitator protein|nr:aquaporin family protein [Propionibacteriaceae bacterium]